MHSDVRDLCFILAFAVVATVGLLGLGIEFMAAAQGLDFRSYDFGRGTRTAHSVVRKHVEFLDVDRPLHRDHNAMMSLVASREILDEVESEIGELGTY